MIQFLINFITSFIITCSFIGLFLWHKKRPIKVYLTPDTFWNDITEVPLPEFDPIEFKTFFVTDGELVDSRYSRVYNKYGQLVFSWDDRIVTHWAYIPSPPEKK